MMLFDVKYQLKLRQNDILLSICNYVYIVYRFIIQSLFIASV